MLLCAVLQLVKVSARFAPPHEETLSWLQARAADESAGVRSAAIAAVRHLANDARSAQLAGVDECALCRCMRAVLSSLQVMCAWLNICCRRACSAHSLPIVSVSV